MPIRKNLIPAEIAQCSIPCPEVLTALGWWLSSCRLEEATETVQRRAALFCVGDDMGDLVGVLCSTSIDYSAITPLLDCLDREFTSKLHPCSS